MANAMMVPNGRVEETRRLVKLYNSFTGFGMHYIDEQVSTPTKDGDCFFIIKKYLDDTDNQEHNQPWCTREEEPETLQVVKVGSEYQLQAWYF